MIERTAKSGEAAMNAVPFEYEARPETGAAGGGPASLFRAPLAVQAVVPLENGTVTIRQNRRREFILEDESGEIGRVTRVGSLNSHEVECRKELDVYDAAAIFAVAEYMYHDDDVAVV